MPDLENSYLLVLVPCIQSSAIPLSVIKETKRKYGIQRSTEGHNEEKILIYNYVNL